MHCFSINDETSSYESMELVEKLGNILETVNLEWHHWEDSESYCPEQIQELLDLVIEQGPSARKTGFLLDIIERTAQYCVKQYRDDEEKHRAGKIEPYHTSFLCSFYAKKPESVLWKARGVLLEMRLQTGLINLSSLHRHLILHASLTLKKLDIFIDQAGFNMHTRRNFVKAVAPLNRGATSLNIEMHCVHNTINAHAV
ncbi:hypothetical protein EDC96DRAFT_558653 [Choanephora cucurbitarum]|nr:hypothetical protein EDC96DRAFT_558653 [Choanephora cucurbitarum]